MLTTGLGALEAGRTAFVQDATAGISTYLDAVAIGGPSTGMRVRLTGTLDDRYGQRTLRTSAAAILVLGPGVLPVGVRTATGLVGEALEGSRVTLAGTVTEPPSALADGLGLTVDDGSGPVRVVVTPAAQGSTAVVAWVRGSGQRPDRPARQHWHGCGRLSRATRRGPATSSVGTASPRPRRPTRPRPDVGRREPDAEPV